jgi:hypothetical protein
MKTASEYGHESAVGELDGGSNLTTSSVGVAEDMMVGATLGYSVVGGMVGTMLGDSVSHMVVTSHGRTIS